jgi:hypothetical protein
MAVNTINNQDSITCIRAVRLKTQGDWFKTWAIQPIFAR